MACAWHRQVRRADARRSQAHAAKKQQEQHRKPNRKARRRGAVPAGPLGDRLPLFPPRTAFSLLVLPFRLPLEFAFSVGYGSIGLRGRQRSQNRRLKHP